jgi:hypothetical protein
MGMSRIRLAHLLPTNDAIDLCVRKAGEPWKQRGVLGGSGRDPASVCGAGLHYTQVTAPFKIAGGQADVKVIPAGQTCSAPSLAEKMGIDVGTDLVVTVAYMGGPSVAPIIAAMPETALSIRVQNRRTRFVNAIPGTTLELGVSAETELPATMATRFANGVEFGRAADSPTGTAFNLDANGYLEFPSIAIPLVAVEAGTTDAVLLVTLAGSGNFTLYAIGDPNTTFPVRGLLCNEAATDTPLATCNLTALPSSN